LGVIVLGLAILVSLTAGCAPTSHALASSKAEIKSTANDDALVQFSLLAALASGDYDDGAPLRQVLQRGDFGIGTFNRLDGEMIVLDGQMYQALGNGLIRPANLESTTPFAAVTFFREDGRIENLAAASLTDLDEQLDRQLPRHNTPYAIRIDGEFPNLTLRSVPAQTPPFQPLVEVVKHQSTWQHHNLRGTLVGFRCPAWVGTLNVAGYHWHFLSEDRATGGHVLACELQNGLVRFDECSSLEIHLPQSPEFDNFDVARIKHQDINQIERLRN